MHYVVSDLHGQYDEFMKMLEVLDLKEDDLLYVLGDVVDRGPKPISIIKEMMKRDNIIPLIGNHDYVALMNFNFLMKEITNESLESVRKNQSFEIFKMWLNDGGMTTLEEFKALSNDEKQDVMDYIGDFSLYEIVTVNNQEYVLVHGALGNFSVDKPLDDYTLEEIIFERMDYDKVYYPDKIVVSGHTPTQLIENHDERGIIYNQNNHLAIDCGSVFGGHLAAYCLETGRVIYIG